VWLLALLGVHTQSLLPSGGSPRAARQRTLTSWNLRAEMPWLLLALSAVRTGSLRQYGTPIFFIVSATWSSMQMTM
jgi:hypothetical protein